MLPQIQGDDQRWKGRSIKIPRLRRLYVGLGLLPFFLLAHFSHHLLTALPIPLIPFIRDEFALDYTQSGVVIAVFSMAYGISNIPAGWFADRLGPLVLLTTGIAGVALAGILVGFSQTYIMMLASLVLMGILAGGYHPSAPALVAASVSPEKRGRALGFHLIGGSASHFVTPLIAATTAVAWGWRSSFFLLAIPVMIFGVLFYFILKRYIATGKSANQVISESVKTPAEPHHVHRLVSIMIVSNLAMAIITSVVSFMPLYAVDKLGFSRQAAAALIAIAYVSGFWAHPLGGYLSDRFGRVPVILGACFTAGPVIYMFSFVSQGLGISALLVIIGTLLFMRMPAAESYVVTHTSERRRSFILGIYFFGNVEGIGLITPILGYLIDHFGFYTTFSIAGAALVTVATVGAILLRGSRY